MLNSFPLLFDNFYKEVEAAQPKLFEIIREYHILIFQHMYFGIWTKRNLGDFLETA